MHLTYVLTMVDLFLIDQNKFDSIVFELFLAHTTLCLTENSLATADYH